MRLLDRLREVHQSRPPAVVEPQPSDGPEPSPYAGVAVPRPETIDALRADVDDVVCLAMPEPFVAIGLHYRDFHQLSDEDVVRALAESEAEAPHGGADAATD